MWPSIVILEDNFVLSLFVLWLFLPQCSVQTHQLRSILTPCNGFTRFEQLTIYHMGLLPPNSEHNLGTVNIWSGVEAEACPGISHNFLRLGLSTEKNGDQKNMNYYWETRSGYSKIGMITR